MNTYKKQSISIIVFFMTAIFSMFFNGLVAKAASEGDVVWEIEDNGLKFIRGIEVDPTGVYATYHNNVSGGVRKTNINDGSSIIWNTNILNMPIDIALDSDRIYTLYKEFSGANYFLTRHRTSDGAVDFIGGSERVYLLPGMYYAGMSVYSGNIYLISKTIENSPLGLWQDTKWVIEKRSTADGTLVPNFGTNGIIISNPSVHPPIGSDADMPRELAIDSSGLYVVGYQAEASFQSFRHKWRIEKRDLITGALLWAQANYIPHPDGQAQLTAAQDIALDSSYAYIVGGYPYGSTGLDSGWFIEKRNKTDGALVAAFGNNGVVTMSGFPYDGGSTAYTVTVDANGLYVGGVNYSGNTWAVAKLSLLDGGVVWQETGLGTIQGEPLDSAIDANGIYFGGVLEDNGGVVTARRIEKRCLAGSCPDFTIDITPLRDATNPNWSEDYLVSIARQGGFNNAVNLSASVAAGASDVSVTWPGGMTIPAGGIGPLIMRVQALDPPAESRRGGNYDITVSAVGGGITKEQGVDFYLNQRPNAQFRLVSNPSIPVGGTARFRDNGSTDPDILAPGNALVVFAADFDGGGIDKCYSPFGLLGCSSNPSDDPRSNLWTFTYNTPGVYQVQYIVFDDLITDPQAVSWNEISKSAGYAAPVQVVVGGAPGLPPVASLEIRDGSGTPISQALVGQTFYGYAGGSNDPDGQIQLVSFCADTTPEAFPPQYNCANSWANPPFDWNTSDLSRGWSAPPKTLGAQLYKPGVYALYTVVVDATGIRSNRLAMDTITILTPPPPTADDQSVATNEDTFVNVALSGNPPPLMYSITSLPANGILRDSTGTVINSVPFTLPDNLVTYIPHPNFFSPPNNSYQFIVNDGVQASTPGTVTVTVNAVNDAPVAAFMVNPPSGQMNTTTFSVDASNSYDIEDIWNVDTRWDWESDGIYDTAWSSVKTADHIYATAGSKTITLEVRDQGSPQLTQTATQTVTVFAPIPHDVSITNSGATGNITSTDGAFNCGNLGLVCGPISYTEGSAIIFQAVPNAAQKYSAGTWGGSCAGPTNIDCFLMVDGDEIVSAAFTPPRALTVTVDGTGAGSVTSSPGAIDCPGVCTDTYTNGASVVLTAAPVNSTTAWIGCDSVLGNDCTVAMTGDKAVIATFTPNPPVPPDSLAGAPTCAGSNDADTALSWTDNATNEDGFSIYRDTNAGFPSPVIIAVGPNTGADPAVMGVVSYTDATPAVSTTYYYKVRAFNTGGESGFSSVISVTTPSCAPTFRLLDSSGDTTASIDAGDTEQYNGRYDSDGPGGPAVEITVIPSSLIAWSSSDTNVATIDVNGLAVGIAGGVAPITITGSYNSLSNTASLEVRGNIAATFRASPPSFIRPPYDSTLTATVISNIGNGDYTYNFDCGNGDTTSITTSNATQSYNCNTYTIPPRNYTASVTITRAGANQFSATAGIIMKPPLPKFKERIPN